MDYKRELGTEYGGPMIKWDDVTIENEALHMPEALRADYLFLKVYGREQCARDIDALTAKMRELGIMHDKTTWSKILRGRWKRDSRGDETPHSVISAEAFSEAVASIRDNVRVEVMRGMVPFVETSTWESISNYIDTRRDPARTNKWGVVVGATGSQKTACGREYRARHNHGTTVLVEAPERGRFGEFLVFLSRAYGMMARTSAINTSYNIFTRLSKGTARERAQRCIIVDNAQELWLGGLDHDQPAFTFLRRLQDTTGCTIILFITPMFERRLVTGMIEGWFEQIEGRSGGRNRWLRLPEYAPEQDVLAIARSFGLTDAKKHIAGLMKIAAEPGRIRRLFEDLQEGKRIAEASKVPFTMAHLIEGRAS